MMAALWLAKFALVTLTIYLVGVFVVAKTDFCGSVFEAQIGRETHRVRSYTGSHLNLLSGLFTKIEFSFSFLFRPCLSWPRHWQGKSCC